MAKYIVYMLKVKMVYKLHLQRLESSYNLVLKFPTAITRFRNILRLLEQDHFKTNTFFGLLIM